MTPVAHHTPSSFGRAVLVRLFAFGLLLGVTALFIDYPALIREASTGLTPLDLNALPIDVTALGPGIVISERHIVGDANARELAVMLRRAAVGDAAPAGTVATQDVVCRLFDGAGAEIGQQRVRLTGGADGLAVLRLLFTEHVRVARVVVEPVP